MVEPPNWHSTADAKSALRRNEPDAFLVCAKWKEDGQERSRDFRLGEVRGSLVKETRGQKFAYVVDTLYSPENAARITSLARDADVFFCESPFLDEDEDQATKRYHLTAKQAGLLGRSANVRKLQVFHFSPRYSDRAQDVYNEAQASFLGESVQAAAPEQASESDTVSEAPADAVSELPAK